MTRSRLLVGVSSHIFDRTVTAPQLKYSRPVYLKAGISILSDAGDSLSLRCRPLNKHHVANTTRSAPFPYTRTLSTNTPQTPTSAKEKDPLPPPGPTKKPKVELRPGPAKPPATTAHAKPSSTTTSQRQGIQPKAPTGAKPHPTKPPPLSASSPKEEALTEVEGKSVIDIAKKDMHDAAQHGILKAPPADASRAGRLFHQAKELFKFYWAGLKFIFAHRKEVQKTQERVKSGGAALTWREHRFILMNRLDMIKLVPFLLTVLVAEELIPVIVMYIPAMLPSTCVLPSQRERIEAKRHKRQREAYALAKTLGAFKDTPIEGVKLKSLDSQQLGLLCSTAGISSWSLLGMQRWRLNNYLRKIIVEDKLLLAEGKGAKLKQAELAAVLYDRGFLAESYTPAQQRDRLRWWLENVQDDASDLQKSSQDVRSQLLVLMLQEARSDSRPFQHLRS